MLKEIQNCFISNKVLYTKHARDEMENDEFGEIKEREVHEAVMSGEIIESYPDDDPYPSCLVFGRTSAKRPLHAVCAYAEDAGTTIVVTVYRPDPDLWIDFVRRKR